MKHSQTVKLKPFQDATVREVCARVSRSKGGVRLALADEVGLGKTHVMGEIARTLGRRGAIVMYVAPSIEVVHQNRGRLQKALGIPDNQGTRALETRLTLLPSELHNASTRLVCLTPNTSFQLRGTGNRRERAFLYAVLLELRERSGMPKNASTGGRPLSWERVFYRPKGRADRWYKEEWQYRRWRSQSGNGKEQARKIAKAIIASGDIDHFANLVTSLRKGEATSLTAAFKRTGRMVSKLRELVAWQVLTGPFKPKVVFFDEWHRYQHLMVEENKEGHALLSRTMSYWREGSRRAPKLVLLVSATPFAVTFGKEREQRSADFERLCKLLDPSGDFFERVEAAQSRFQAAWEEFAEALTKNKNVTAAQKKCRREAEQFSNVLYCRIVRTERPVRTLNHHKSVHSSHDEAVGRWDEADLRSLYRARRLAASQASGSDVIGLWHSSTHFLRMPDAYQIAAKTKAKSRVRNSIANHHWKRARFEELLVRRWGGTPPLWISPRSALNGAGKILVFSAWRSVPRELTFFFHDRAKIWRARRGPGASPLGAFPLFDGSAEREELSLKKQGWRIFYPSLCACDKDFGPFLSWVKTQMGAEHSHHRRGATDWAGVFYGLDLAYCDYLRRGKLLVPLARRAAQATEQRRRLLKRRKTSDWRELLGKDVAGFKALQRAVNSRASWRILPGWSLVQGLRKGAGNVDLLDPQIQREVLRLARGVNNYFNRPVCQALVEAHHGRKSKFYSDAVINYCLDHQWIEMWMEFASLLEAEERPGAMLKTMGESLETKAARRAGVGWAVDSGKGRIATIVQPFVEAKAGGQKTPEEAERESLVTSQRRLTFNSPFFPHVLVSTSIGQEGVDFHRYCDTVIHWNPPLSPLALEQREGRIDRYRSLQVRLAHASRNAMLTAT